MKLSHFCQDLHTDPKFTHSLGNLVVGSAIQDYGAHPANYFMFDAAMPLEAYNGNATLEPQMIHPDWNSYSSAASGSYTKGNRVFSTEWYLNPTFGVGDARKNLTWRNRLMNVGANSYNFYSASEDVLRKHDGDPGVGDTVQTAMQGMLHGSGFYAWALQEKLKGRRVSLGIGFVGSTYGGWQFTSVYDDSVAPAPPHPHTPTASEAAGISDQTLKTMPVFDPGYSLNYTTKVPHANAPGWIGDLTDSTNGSATAQAHRPELLAAMFPARTLPAGANNVASFGGSANFNMPDFITDLSKWPRPLTVNGSREWWHGDVKNVAYSHMYHLFDQINTTAKLNQ